MHIPVKTTSQVLLWQEPASESYYQKKVSSDTSVDLASNTRILTNAEDWWENQAKELTMLHMLLQ